MLACFKCFRPKWVNDRILLGQWLVHALVLAIVREMGRNTRKTLYKCIKVQIYKEKCQKLTITARKPTVIFMLILVLLDDREFLEAHAVFLDVFCNTILLLVHRNSENY